MIKLLIMVALTLCVPVIVLSGCKVYNQTKNKALKLTTMSLLCIEIFKFFFVASLFNGGATPAANISFSIITLLTVLALFGLFSKDKKFGVITKTVMGCAIVPVIFAMFNSDTYLLAADIHGVVAGAYFVQCGLLLTLLALNFKDTKIKLTDTLVAVLFIGFVFGLTVLTNYAWGVNLLFVNDMVKNTLMISVALVSPIFVYLSSLLYNKVTGGKE